MTICQKVSGQLVKRFMFDSHDSTSLHRCIHKWNNWKLIYRNQLTALSWLVSNVGTFIQWEMNFSMSGKITSNFYWCTKSAWRKHCCDKRESVSASVRIAYVWQVMANHFFNFYFFPKSIITLPKKRPKRWLQIIQHHYLWEMWVNRWMTILWKSKIKIYQHFSRFWNMRQPNEINYVNFANVIQNLRKLNDRLQKCVICSSVYRHW